MKFRSFLRQDRQDRQDVQDMKNIKKSVTTQVVRLKTEAF